MLKLNTIDLDHSAEAVLGLVLIEISKCKHIKNIEWRQSPSKRGFHIKFFCDKDCCICRELYDDQMRISADLTNRKPYERDVLWDKKSYNTTGGKIITKKAGNWHKYK